MTRERLVPIVAFCSRCKRSASIPSCNPRAPRKNPFGRARGAGAPNAQGRRQSSAGCLAKQFRILSRNVLDHPRGPNQTAARCGPCWRSLLVRLRHLPRRPVPGHGKAVISSYLVAKRGNRAAAAIALAFRFGADAGAGRGSRSSASSAWLLNATAKTIVRRRGAPSEIASYALIAAFRRPAGLGPRAGGFFSRVCRRGSRRPPMATASHHDHDHHHDHGPRSSPSCACARSRSRA